MVALVELVGELKALRKGRGLLASHIGERIGTGLRAVCDVRDEDGPAVIRQKVARRLENLAGDLPADLRMAVLAAFAIAPDARQPFYQDRVSWTADRLNRDPRTARRRIDAGIDHLAQLATDRAVAPSRTAAESSSVNGWRTAELRVVVALDRDRPEVVEVHRIVAERDGLAAVEVTAAFGVTVLYGAKRVRGGTADLPTTLRSGAEHELAIQYRLPDAAAAHVVRTPDRPCDLFDLRLRFDRARPPWRIWQLRGALDRDVADPEPAGEPRHTDGAGEVHLVFRDLVPGLAYGARWEPH